MVSLSRDKIFLNIAFSILLGIFSIYILSSLGFILGLPINLGYMLLATILLIFVPLKYCKTNIYENLLSLIFIISAVVIFYFISAYIVDFSYDGPWYHQSGILFLKKGWNPIYTSAEEFFNANWNTHIDGLVWIDSYPKFYEIFAANIFYLTGNIETGKILNFLSLTVLFFYAFYVLEKQLLKNKPFLCFIFSFLLILNPVVLAQIYTYYVDGLVYIYFMLLMLSLVDIQQSKNNNKVSRFVLIISATLLANLKLVSLLYAIFILIAYAGFKYFWKNKLKNFGIDCAIIAVLILLTGINPYFTNLYKGKNLFYPVVGSEKIDIMRHNMPSQFFDKPMPYKLFISTFCRVENSLSEFLSLDKKLQLKIPFTVYKSEMAPLQWYDVRQSGFGVFWSGILLIALALAFFIRNKNMQTKHIYMFLMTTLLISIIANTENWWARYVPQFYALPIFVLLFYYITNPSRRRFCIISLTAVLIFINSAISFWKINERALYITAIRINQLYNMSRMKNDQDLIKQLEQAHLQRDFTAPILLFLDEAKRK